MFPQTYICQILCLLLSLSLPFLPFMESLRWCSSPSSGRSQVTPIFTLFLFFSLLSSELLARRVISSWNYPGENWFCVLEREVNFIRSNFLLSIEFELKFVTSKFLTVNKHVFKLMLLKLTSNCIDNSEHIKTTEKERNSNPLNHEFILLDVVDSNDRILLSEFSLLAWSSHWV